MINGLVFSVISVLLDINGGGDRGKFINLLNNFILYRSIGINTDIDAKFGVTVTIITMAPICMQNMGLNPIAINVINSLQNKVSKIINSIVMFNMQ